MLAQRTIRNPKTAEQWDADAFNRPARLWDHLHRRLAAGSFGCGMKRKKKEQVRLKDYDRSWAEWGNQDDLPVEKGG